MAICLLLSSCSAWKQVSRDIEVDVARGEYQRAITALKEGQNTYGESSSVLYRLELGMLFHYAGEYDSSTAQLLAAEREIEDLYTKSISRAAVSLVLNDNVLPYEGEDFENTMLNVVVALNFEQQGEIDEALVEARKVDLKLRELSRRYEGNNSYTEDAFSRYLAGVLYENAGEINDAFISYRLALEAYRAGEERFRTSPPPFLLDDLVRTATMLSFTEEAGEYREAGGKPFLDDDRRGGRILVLVYAGKGPVKEEIRPSVSIADDEGTIHTFQVALPQFVVRYLHPRDYAVRVIDAPQGGPEISTQCVVGENVNAIAAQTLADRLGLIYLKSGGRALLKFLAAEKAKQELKKNDSETTNVLGSIAIDILVAATEQADLRSWTTLPAEVQMGQLALPAGTYSLQVSAGDGGFREALQDVKVRSGKTAVVIVEDVR
jgi:hypothetical protein